MGPTVPKWYNIALSTFEVKCSSCAVCLLASAMLEAVLAGHGDIEVVDDLLAVEGGGTAGGSAGTLAAVFGPCPANIAKLRTIVTTFPMILPWLPLPHLH